MNKPLMGQLRKLSSAEKIDLIGELWDSIPPAELPPLTRAQIEGLDRRMAEHEADPSSAIPYDEMMKRLRSRFE
jgi:putative addiction module component (TIGR02574 family)